MDSAVIDLLSTQQDPCTSKTYERSVRRILRIHKMRPYKVSLLQDLSDDDLSTTKWLPSCERDDPQLDECLRNVLANIFPQLAVGIPEINVEGFEPLYLDRMTLSKVAGPVTLTGSFSNITVVGPSNSTPTYTRMNIRDRKMDLGIYFPHLDIVSKYDLKGKILILPLVGNGDCKMTLGGVDTMITTNISFVLREGKEVLKIHDMHTRYTMKNIKVQLSNLFNGNKLLGKQNCMIPIILLFLLLISPRCIKRYTERKEN
ncbi:hypothetical protein MML48_3g00015609 [Holotrichia oblita]|uniref:Uncharacterized protein n=1 Tax=Holotrichia oblita TaxID=644536 RepID=A0ACB9TGF7_HOLOL|nr:hypothetical protein MML48_3g00015609 [Holotrichia oblita]